MPTRSCLSHTFRVLYTYTFGIGQFVQQEKFYTGNIDEADVRRRFNAQYGKTCAIHSITEI